MKSVLFVCKGNICRSPLAEGIARERLRAAGIDVRVDSAGTQDYHVGSPPDPRAIAVARAAGIDIAGLRARQLGESDFERFDVVLAADRENLDCIARRHPHLRRPPVLLLEWCTGENAEVPDPYSGSRSDFEHVFRLLDGATEGLLRRLRQAS